MRIAVIAHPGSRGGLAGAESALAPLRDAGHEPRLLLSDAPGGSRRLAREAAEDGVDLVVASGGDGTLGEVTAGLLEAPSAPPLGILPTGTGNDTAKALRIPLAVGGAIERIVRGTPTPIDLAEVNGTPFLGLGVMGFAARVGETVNRWKSGRWRPVARLFGQRVYHIASAYYLLFPPASLRATIACDEYEREAIVFALLVTNHPGVRGVFVPCPRASSSDGLIDVCIFRARAEGCGEPRRLWLHEKLRTAHRTLAGDHTEEPWVDYFQTAGPLRVHLRDEASFVGDGETLSRGTEFAIRCLPAALRVML